MKKKELVEVKIKLYKHQVEWLEECAKRSGIAMSKRNNGVKAWVNWGKILRINLDTWIFLVKPNIKEILKEIKKRKFSEQVSP